MSGPDYYALLGVSRDAELAAIKQAYRRLALRYHPDRRGGDPSAAEAFRLVTEAYRVLRDPRKRPIYDRFGSTGLTIQEGPAADLTMAEALETFVRDFGAFSDIGTEAAAAAEAALRADPAGRRTTRDRPRAGPVRSPETARSGQRTQQRREARPPGRKAPVRAVALTLEEVDAGVVRALRPPCGACRGSGERRGELQRVCERCDGVGDVQVLKRTLLGPTKAPQRCPDCGGSGRRPLPPCPACRGTGDLPNSNAHVVEIPPGVRDGGRIEVGPADDRLDVRVQVMEHERFVRVGDDLQAELPLTFTQAALGAVMDVPTLRGRGRVRVPAGTQPGEELRVQGDGLPETSGVGRGDLLLRTTLTVPRKLAKEDRKLLKELEFGGGRIGGLRYILPAAALLIATVSMALWYWQGPQRAPGGDGLVAAGPPGAAAPELASTLPAATEPAAGGGAQRADPERAGGGPTQPEPPPAGPEEVAGALAVLPAATGADAAAGSDDARLLVGGAATCAGLDGGRLRCWGSGRGPLRLAAIPRTGDPRSISVGMRHACVVDVAGALSCWGANESGQIGDGGTRDRRGPWPVRAQAPFAEVAVGAGHTCALGETGALSCWGAIAGGRSAPGVALDGAMYGGLVGGWTHACALDTDGYAHCLGGNRFGQVGDGTTRDRDVPAPVASDARFVALAAGSGHTCGVDVAGRAWCWGRNDGGQLGLSGGAPAVRPVELEAPVVFVFVTAGARFTCALDEEARAWCWGANGYGQLGTGDTDGRARPSPVRGGLRFRTIQAGAAHVCGQTTQGELVCWGANVAGQLGDASRGNRSSPVLLPGD
ncbi:MAG: DnaJ domain-containing protein [Gemmatimonadota bacterium]